jgi:large repetitive protein
MNAGLRPMRDLFRKLCVIMLALGVVPAAAQSPSTDLGSVATQSVVRNQLTTPQAPAITGVSPNSGTMAGGTPVVISGTTLSGATAVSFSACGAAASYVVNGPGQITAVSPACSAQPVDLRVTTPYGTSPIVTGDDYTFAAPSVPPWLPFQGGQLIPVNKTRP